MKARAQKGTHNKGGEETEIWSKWQTVGAAEKEQEKKAGTEKKERKKAEKAQAAHSVLTVLYCGGSGAAGTEWMLTFRAQIDTLIRSELKVQLWS